MYRSTGRALRSFVAHRRSLRCSDGWAGPPVKTGSLEAVVERSGRRKKRCVLASRQSGGGIEPLDTSSVGVLESRWFVRVLCSRTETTAEGRRRCTRPSCSSKFRRTRSVVPSSKNVNSSRCSLGETADGPDGRSRRRRTRSPIACVPCCIVGPSPVRVPEGTQAPGFPDVAGFHERNPRDVRERTTIGCS